MLKIGVISDTHASGIQELPGKLLEVLKQVDLILHAGDIVRVEVLEELKKIGPELRAVYGNMDPFKVRETLKDTEIIEEGNIRIGLTHGLGTPHNLIETVKKKFKNEELDAIVYGHSHHPYNKVHQGILYFNPGSPTDKIFAPYNSYGILEVSKTVTGKIIKI